MNYSDACNERIKTCLENAISTMRKAMDEAEKRLNNDPHSITPLISIFRNGCNNAMAYVESAVDAQSQKIEIT
jgi:hypothetical protein